MKNKKWLMPVVSICMVLAIAVAAVVLWPGEKESEKTGNTVPYTTRQNTTIIPALKVTSTSTIPASSGTTDSSNTVLHEGVSVEEGAGWDPDSNVWYCGVPIKLNVDETVFPGMTITFELSTTYPLSFSEKFDHGTPYENIGEAYRGTEVTLENGTTIYWGTHTQEEENYLVDCVLSDDLLAQVVIKADGRVVGFAVLALERMEYGKPWFWIQTWAMEIYPPVDGQLLDINEEYVINKIEDVKQYMKRDGRSPEER